MPIAVGTGQHIVDVRIKALSEQRVNPNIGRKRQRISMENVALGWDRAPLGLGD